MPTIVSIASGKGGVGKSVLTSNLGLILARRGLRVVVADMDIGGANQHIMFGLLQPERTLTHFLNREIPELSDVLMDVEICPRLQLLAGTGETLATANPRWATKQRLINHMRKLDADVVLVDVSAGTNYHVLDFFLMADFQIVVTTPEPTAIFDCYKLVKLSVIRRVLSMFLGQSDMKARLQDKDFGSIEDVVNAVVEGDVAEDEAKTKAEAALRSYHPLLVINRVQQKGSRLRILQMKKTLQRYVGTDLEVLGEIPSDYRIEKSINNFLPVCEFAPRSLSACAIRSTAESLMLKIERFQRRSS
jgi:flagellar biosynthesis protein FlhG